MGFVGFVVVAFVTVSLALNRKERRIFVVVVLLLLK
jgi:hypothetical protein